MASSWRLTIIIIPDTIDCFLGAKFFSSIGIDAAVESDIFDAEPLGDAAALTEIRAEITGSSSMQMYGLIATKRLREVLTIPARVRIATCSLCIATSLYSVDST